MNTIYPAYIGYPELPYSWRQTVEWWWPGAGGEGMGVTV
jgi:hypothetical protein